MARDGMKRVPGGLQGLRAAMEEENLPPEAEKAQRKAEREAEAEAMVRLQTKAKKTGETGKGKKRTQTQRTSPALTTQTTPPAESRSMEVTKVVTPAIPANRPVPAQPAQPTSAFREFGIKPIFPRIQAVINQVLELQGTKECRVEVHRAEKQTFLTLTPDREGIVTVPEGVFPNAWRLTAAFPVETGRADGVAFLDRGKAVGIKYYRILPANSDRPDLRLYNFARTENNVVRAYTIQVNKDREVLITEWSISILNATQAKRVREGTPVRERLPMLESMERTEKALGPILAPLARTICFLYDRACGKPMPSQPAIEKPKA